MAFKIKVVTEAEAVENNLEIAQDYELGESMVQRWGRDQATILSGELICWYILLTASLILFFCRIRWQKF